MSVPNPYEPPSEDASAAPNFRESDSEVVELRRRVEALERRLGKNWLVSPNQFLRMFAVVGYLFLAYALIASIAWILIGLTRLVMHISQPPGGIP
jgi:hypothetical protein